MKDTASRLSKKLDNQWVATIAVLLLLSQIGILVGWTSPNIAYLLSPESANPMTKDQVSWLASCLSLGSILGSILGSLLNMHVGSRKCILLVLVTLSISWILIIVGDTADYLYAARLLGGIGKGANYACFSLYLAEIASPAKRGTLISTAGIGLPAGFLLGTTAETYIGSMKLSSAIYLGMCLADLAIFLYLMDSPYSLAKKSDDEHTSRSIEFYDSSEKLDDIKLYVAAADAKSDFKSRARELRRPVARRSMLLIIVMFSLSNLAGPAALATYPQVILEKSKSNIIDPQQFLIYSRVVSTIISFLARGLIDRLGRRLVLAVSSVAVALGMIVMAVHFTLLEHPAVEIRHVAWLPLFSTLLESAFFNVGFLSVTQIVLSEIFAESIKSLAACVAALVAALATFVAVKTYQPLVDAYGEACPFWLYAGFALSYLPVVRFMMIETRGKSFQEIQEELHRVWAKDVKEESDQWVKAVL